MNNFNRYRVDDILWTGMYFAYEMNVPKEKVENKNLKPYLHN